MALYGPLQFVNVSLEMGELKWDTVFQVWQSEIMTSLDLLTTLLLMQPRTWFAFIVAMGQLPTHVQLTVHQYFQSHSLANEIPACVAAWVYSIPHARLYIYLC